MSNLASISITSSRTNHPFTAADQAVMAQVRAMVEPNKGKLRGVAARPMFDDIIRRAAPPEGANFKEGEVGGVSGWWADPEGAATGRVILHLHGGWFNWGGGRPKPIVISSAISRAALLRPRSSRTTAWRRSTRFPPPVSTPAPR